MSFATKSASGIVKLTQAWQQCAQPFLQASATPLPLFNVASAFEWRNLTAGSMFLACFALSRSACSWRAIAAVGSGSLESGSMPALSLCSSSLIWRRRSARFIECSFVAADAGRLDLEDHPHLAGLGKGIFVLAQIFFGERVDVLRGALLRHMRDPAPDLHVAVGIVGIDHGEGNRGALLHVRNLDAAARGVNAHLSALVIKPDRRHLRRSIRH